MQVAFSGVSTFGRCHLPSCCLQGGCYKELGVSAWFDEEAMQGDINSTVCPPALEATQGQMGGFLSQLPYKCYPSEVASVAE